jgi:hypothetical protein
MWLLHSLDACCKPAQRLRFRSLEMYADLYLFDSSIFFLTSLIVVSVYISRHREAGGHNTFGSVPPQYAINHDTSAPYNTNYPVQSQNYSLRENNLALQQQYFDLQRQHIALQQQVGLIPPPPAMQQPIESHKETISRAVPTAPELEATQQFEATQRQPSHLGIRSIPML